ISECRREALPECAGLKSVYNPSFQYEPLFLFLLHRENQVLLFVFLQDEVGGGAGDAFHGGQLLTHEPGHLLQGAPRDDDGEVEGTAHQKEGFHFIILVNALGNAVEAVAPLGGDLHLNEGGDRLPVGTVPVHNGLVAQNHTILLVVGNGCCHVLLGRTGHRCQLGGGEGAIIFQKLQQLFHGTSSFAYFTAFSPCNPGVVWRNVVETYYTLYHSAMQYSLWGGGRRDFASCKICKKVLPMVGGEWYKMLLCELIQIHGAI